MIRRMVAAWEKTWGRIPLLASAYSHRYRSVVMREIDLGGITGTDRVLNIGSGGVPFTAMLLAEMTGARVTALDLDPHAAGRARELVATMGLSELIDVKVGDGCRISAAPFSAALVALQAEPKGDILRNLLCTGLEGFRAIIREPRGRFEDNYDRVPADFVPVAAVEQDKITFDRSVLYLKGTVDHGWRVGRVRRQTDGERTEGL